MRCASSNDNAKTTTGFDGKGNAIPSEMLADSVNGSGIEFKLPHVATGTEDAIAANGQVRELPHGDYNRVYVLAASSTAMFRRNSR